MYEISSRLYQLPREVFMFIPQLRLNVETQALTPVGEGEKVVAAKILLMRLVGKSFA